MGDSHDDEGCIVGMVLQYLMEADVLVALKKERGTGNRAMVSRFSVLSCSERL